MTLDELACVVFSTSTLAVDRVVLVLTSVVLLPVGVVASEGVVLVNGVVGGSNAPLLKIDTVVPNESSESNASTKSLAEYTLTLPGLTSKFASVGSVEGTVNAESVVVSGENVELKGSVIPFSVVLSVVTGKVDGITACVVVLGLEVVVSIVVLVDGTTVVVVGTTVAVGGVVRVGIVVLGILVVVSVTGLNVDDINLAREVRVS